MKLDSKQIAKLRDEKSSIDYLLGGIGGLFGLFLILGFVPSGMIPSRRGRRSSSPNESLVDLVGIIPFMLFLVVAGGLGLLYVYKHYKYQELQQDLIFKEVVTVKTKAIDARVKANGPVKDVTLIIDPPFRKKNAIKFEGYTNFPKIKRGQEVEIQLTDRALFPVGINVLGQEEPNGDDIQKALDLIRKLNNQ